MEALRLNEYITEKGLFIDYKKLEKFKNSRVEVIILPLEEMTIKNKTDRKSIKNLTQYSCSGKKMDFSREDAYEDRL